MSALKLCPQCGSEYPASERFCPRDGTALRSQSETGDLVGSIVADRYHVLRKLGEGGMGQVYLVEHVKMGRKSALKVMHPGMVQDADAIARFNREAANASRINHPNVAGIYDFGETPEGLIYLAMEFVEGPPLTNMLEQLGALPPIRAAEIVRQAAEALAVAHDMGIVHRDLKPDNIMVARTRDGGDLVKVVDFGIAKAAGSESQKVTKTGLVVGTPEYMSPEQLSGDKLDGRSDIYSLGLVAFNLLTGKLPFPSESAQESMIMRLTDRPRPLATMKPDVDWPPEVQAVMDRALERDATARYQNAVEFGRELVRAVERMPETVVAAAGTMVLGAEAIPPTRVAPGAHAAGTRTPPTMVAKPAAAAGRRMPLLAAAAVLVLAAGGGIGWAMTRGGTQEAGGDPAATIAEATPQGTAADSVPSVDRPNQSSANPQTLSRPTDAAPPGRLAPAPVAADNQPVASVSFLLQRLEAKTDPSRGDENTARDALRELDQLDARITNLDDDTHAKVLRAEANFLLDRIDAGCDVLKQVEGRAGARQNRVRSLLRDLCGSQP